MSTSIERRKYMLQRLRLLHDGKVLVGTPEEYMEQHDRAYEDLLRARAVHRPAFAADNLDLVGGAI